MPELNDPDRGTRKQGEIREPEVLLTDFGKFLLRWPRRSGLSLAVAGGIGTKLLFWDVLSAAERGETSSFISMRAMGLSMMILELGLVLTVLGSQADVLFTMPDRGNIPLRSALFLIALMIPVAAAWIYFDVRLGELGHQRP